MKALLISVTIAVISINLLMVRAADNELPIYFTDTALVLKTQNRQPGSIPAAGGSGSPSQFIDIKRRLSGFINHPRKWLDCVDSKQLRHFGEQPDHASGQSRSSRQRSLAGNRPIFCNKVYFVSPESTSGARLHRREFLQAQSNPPILL
jgi:hypothetical protein